MSWHFIVIYVRSPLPPGFYLKVIPQDTADYIAKNWSPAAIEYPLEYRTRFIRDLMTHFWFLGVYKMDEHKYPVAWVGRKTGTIVCVALFCGSEPIEIS